MSESKKKRDVDCTLSTGNVFEDMGFAADEAMLMSLKNTLEIKLEMEAKRRGLSDQELVEKLNIKLGQALVDGKQQEPTLGMLVMYASRMGLTVELNVAPK